ncbi:hypothetical protein LP421_17000 [Rhizobium sp. RCAM05350]|nr:hypothetical protein LP421_17000 [Rhizobium sp. RCAM05350]
MSDGVRITDKTQMPTIDQIVGIKTQGGKAVGLIAFEDFEQQLLAGELSGIANAVAEVSALDSRVENVEDDVATLSGAITSPGKVYLTQTAMAADLVPAADTLAQVTTDTNFVNNEYLWKKVGATTTGSWTQTTIPAPALNNRRLDDLETEPALRNRMMGTDKYDAMVVRDSANQLVVGMSQKDGDVQVGRWTHKPSLARFDPYHAPGYPALVTGGDLVVYHENGSATIHSDDWDFLAPGPGSVFAAAVWTRPGMADDTPVQIDRNLELFVPYGEKLITVIMEDAQSNAVGSHAVGDGMWLNPAPDYILMPYTGYNSDVRCGLHTSSGSAPVLAPGAITGLAPMESAVGGKELRHGPDRCQKRSVVLCMQT